jgi:endonuclease YncB( thermonuclease family)
MKKLISILLLLAITISLQSQFVKGKCIRVVDGDTYIFVSVGNDTLKVRDAFINTPEGKNGACSKEQPFYNEASLFATNLLLGKKISIKIKGVDVYGRTIALTKIGRKFYHNILVVNGIGWAYEQKGIMFKKQRKAKRKTLGLWALPNSINPTDWLNKYSTKKQII